MTKSGKSKCPAVGRVGINPTPTLDVCNTLITNVLSTLFLCRSGRPIGRQTMDACNTLITNVLSFAIHWIGVAPCRHCAATALCRFSQHSDDGSYSPICFLQTSLLYARHQCVPPKPLKPPNPLNPQHAQRTVLSTAGWTC